ncbi:MAG: hypothetical protein QOD77_2060 [Thermoplasmata archaeon]|jgi:asparagine synthase (glutamine-hydrolysing)|nr:hypothetical protein [Thermoplasmata archaeon]
MCGIAGLIGRDDRALARRMCGRLAHRGPDGEEVWSDAGATLGHRRLAVLDLATGAQPMQDRSGRFTIVYNGEIYNHRGLRLRLEREGVVFRTRSDTEVLVEGWARWGPAVLPLLEGMYAFVLWDGQERQAVLARDRWGVKPLLVTRVEGDWLFASEAKAFAAHPGFRFEVDEDAVRRQAVFEFDPFAGSLFAGVGQVAPGTFWQLRPGGQPVVHEVAWPAPAGPVDAHELSRRIQASVAQQQESDVPLGIVLSGGLDSALVAHLANQNSPGLPTFAIAESDEVEDLRRARHLADLLGTEHHESTFTFDEAAAMLPRHAYHQENTNYTELFFLPLFERMRRHVTVGLCGQGADELWGGYARYADPQARARLRHARLARTKPQDADALAALIDATHGSGEALARFDQGAQLDHFQLRLVDRNAMAFGLEVRVPFLSHGLQEASDAAAWSQKRRDGTEKWLLRKAADAVGLHPGFAWRPKVPAGRATAPAIAQRIEALGERLRPPGRVAAHPLAGAFENGAECLLFDLWRTIFVENQGDARGVTLEGLA